MDLKYIVDGMNVTPPEHEPTTPPSENPIKINTKFNRKIETPPMYPPPLTPEEDLRWRPSHADGYKVMIPSHPGMPYDVCMAESPQEPTLSPNYFWKSTNTALCSPSAYPPQGTYMDSSPRIPTYPSENGSNTYSSAYIPRRYSENRELFGFSVSNVYPYASLPPSSDENVLRKRANSALPDNIGYISDYPNKNHRKVMSEPIATNTSDVHLDIKSPTSEILSDEKVLNPVEQVKNHIIVHEIEQKGLHGSKSKIYGCQDCGRKFFRKSDLVRHIQIHLGIKPNVCKYCGKKFIQRSALTVHNRVHTGEKPYSCNICSHAFSDSSSLARHRRIHDRKKPKELPTPMKQSSPTST